MPEWVKIDNVSREIEEEPWSLYWTEMKSESDEFEAFLRNPRESLMSGIREVRDDFAITTEHLNHEVGFRTSAVCQVVMVMPEERRVKVMTYKH